MTQLIPVMCERHNLKYVGVEKWILESSKNLDKDFKRKLR